MEKTGNYLKGQGAQQILSVYDPSHLQQQIPIALSQYKIIYLYSNTQLDTDKQSTS